MTSEPRAFIVRGDDGEEYGPVDLDELRDWAVENRVGLGTEVRRDGSDGEWQPWQHFPELVALLAQVHASGRPLPPLPQSLPVLAPIWRRFAAGVADLVLCHVLLMPLIFACIFLLPIDLASRLFLQSVIPSEAPVQLPGWFELLIDSIYFGGLVLYYTFFHALHGQTPAKSVLGLRVVDAGGRKPPLSKAFIRALVLVVSIIPPIWSIPLFAIFFNPQRRGLHDFAAGTYVVER